MAKYKFRLLMDYTNGTKEMYIAHKSKDMTAGYSDFYFINTDDSLTYSSSQVLTTIEDMRSASYTNSSVFTGSIGSGVADNSLATFHLNSAFKPLSASLSGSDDSGSIVLTANSNLKRYKFFGEKVCSVLGFPENIWIYPETAVISNTGSEETRIRGNLQSRALTVTNTFNVSNIGSITSDLPFRINKESDRWIKWVNTTSSANFDENNLLIGYNSDTDRYELRNNLDATDPATFCITASHMYLTDDLYAYGGITLPQNTKLQFDSSDTYILADTAGAENLEIHADNNIELKADNFVDVSSPISMSSTLHIENSDPRIIIGNPTLNSVESGKISFQEGDSVERINLKYDGSANKFHIETQEKGNVFSIDRVNGYITASNNFRLKGKEFHRSNTDGPEFLFHWGGRNSDGSDSDYTWKKIAEIHCGSSTYEGASGWANITNHGSNFGNSADVKEFPFYWMVYYTGGGSDGDQNTAGVRGFQVHSKGQDIFRVVKVDNSGNYELQVHQVGISWRDMTIRAGVYSMGGSTTINWLDTPTNATNAQTVYYGTPSATQYFQEGYFGGNVRIGSGSRTDTNLSIYKADDNVSDHLKFFLGSTRMGEIGAEDTSWLRINQETDKKIYTPRFFRADDGASLGTSATAQNYVGGLTVGVESVGTEGTGRDGVPIARFHRGASANFIDIYGDSAANYIQSGDSGDNQKQLVIAAQASSTATKTIQFQIGQTDGTFDEKVRIDNDGLTLFSTLNSSGNQDVLTIDCDHENTSSIAFIDNDAVGTQDMRISYNTATEKLTFDKDDFDNILSLTGDSNGPHVGIGVSAPTGFGNTFRIHGTTGAGTPLAVMRHNSTTDGQNNDILTLQYGNLSGPNSNERYLNFAGSSGTYQGSVLGESDGSGVNYSGFTGAHHAQFKSGSTADLKYNGNYSTWKQGMIVESTGIALHSGSSAGIVEVVVTENSASKAVIGVFSEFQKGAHPESSSESGHNIAHLDSYRDVCRYNSLGDGTVLVTDSGGNIEVGDYIMSSDRLGHGMKQSDDILRNYTVAKASEPIDFSTVEVDSDLGYKSILVSCTYHCG